MNNDEKIDSIYKTTIIMKERLNNVCDTVDKHNIEIYGNGKDGLKTSMSLVEDNLDGLGKGYRSLKLLIKEQTEKLIKLSTVVNINLAKVSAISVIIYLVMGLISIGILKVVK